jgi:hypothetical protein
MQKEFETMAMLLRDGKVQMVAAIDALKIENEIMKRYMHERHPEFPQACAKRREEAIQAVDPEWIGRQTRTRLW